MSVFTLNNYLYNAASSNQLLNLANRTFNFSPPEPEPEDDQPDLFAAEEMQASLFAAVNAREKHPSITFSKLVSPEFRAKILAAWERIHPSIQSVLTRRGVSITVPVSWTEHDGRSSVADSTLGVFLGRSRRIIIPELTGCDRFWLVPDTRPAAVLYHELGHAIDEIFHTPSNSLGFQAAHRADREAIDSASHFARCHERYIYGTEAACEVFAETWCHQALANGAGRENSYDEDFAKYFPKSWDWMQATIPSGMNGFALPEKTINQADVGAQTPIELLEENVNDAEFIEILHRGVNPLRLSPANATTLLDRCIKRHQTVRLTAAILHLAANPMLQSGLLVEYDVHTIRRDREKWRNYFTVHGDGQEPLLAAFERLQQV